MTGGQKILPKLEINDTVEYQGNMYIVRHITYNYLSKAQMTLGIEDYEAPPLELQKMDIEPKGLAYLEPETPLFISGHYEKQDDGTRVYIPLEEMIPKINGNVWNYLTKLAEDIRNEMGEDFETIALTSAYRSKEYQRDRVFLKKIKLQGASSMYGYYKTRAKASTPYLKVIQYLYDGVYEHKIDSVSRELYLADLQEIKNEERRKVFQSIIEEKYNDLEYVIDSYEKDEFAITRLLTKSYVNPPILLFNPSYHAITDDENNPSSWAVDLRKSKESRRLSVLHDERKSGGSYDGSSDGEPHYHITVKI